MSVKAIDRRIAWWLSLLIRSKTCEGVRGGRLRPNLFSLKATAKNAFVKVTLQHDHIELSPNVNNSALTSSLHIMSISKT